MEEAPVETRHHLPYQARVWARHFPWRDVLLLLVPLVAKEVLCMYDHSQAGCLNTPTSCSPAAPVPTEAVLFYLEIKFYLKRLYL